MDQRGGEVAGPGAAVERLLVPADAVEEVPVVGFEVGGAGSFGDELIPPVVEPPAARRSDDQHARRAVEGRSVLVALPGVWGPPLEDELLLHAGLSLDGVLEEGVVQFGELPVVAGVLRSQAGGLARVGGNPEAPAGHLDLLESVVADIAAPEVMLPGPGSVEQVRAAGKRGRRPQPEVEVKMNGGSSRPRFSDGPAESAFPCL